MAPSTINILLSSFPGLGLPQTLCIPVSSSTSLSAFSSILADVLPGNVSDRLTLSTVSGKIVNPSSQARITSLCPSTLSQHATILSLRLSVPILGGKGGFGSQLRAAGGRMSSRKKKAQGDPNASSRNLDGRRLRTVAEAKALAEYLAVKPDMDRKEKEERRKRWEQVVEASERKQEEIKSGNNAKARVDGKWLEAKEEAESKTREAIANAMREGLLRGDVHKMMDEEDSSSLSEHDDEDASGEGSSKETTPSSQPESVEKPQRRLFGWDEEEEEEDSEDDEADQADER